MKARATRDFRATVSGRDFACGAGETLEADKITVARLERIGLVTTEEPKRASKPRKADNDD